jgi:hypothetical protein
MATFLAISRWSSLLFALALLQTSDAVEIILKNGTSSERQAQAQLERFIQKYDLHRWTFTRTVTIDEKTHPPHSHPVLTLNARYLDDDVWQLSTYVHEQLHWFFSDRQQALRAATDDLKKIYPDVPKGPPEGARDERSTYLHLFVCYLEYDALTQLLGPEAARTQIEKLADHHYKWVYRTVLKDGDKLRTILERHSLIP